MINKHIHTQWPGFVLRQLLGHSSDELAPQNMVHWARLEAVQAESCHRPLGCLPGWAHSLLQDVSSLHHPEHLNSLQLLARRDSLVIKQLTERKPGRWKGEGSIVLKLGKPFMFHILEVLNCKKERFYSFIHSSQFWWLDMKPTAHQLGGQMQQEVGEWSSIMQRTENNVDVLHYL